VKTELELFGQRVQDLRVKKGLSRDQLAVLCSFHLTYIGQVERGEKNISFENLMKFSRALGITISELLSGLESGAVTGDTGSDRKHKGHIAKSVMAPLQIQALIRRLIAQQTAIDRTISMLADIASAENVGARTPRRKKPVRRSPKKGDPFPA
jgi:transcriptional regulator with XRE-family HTH domain